MGTAVAAIALVPLLLAGCGSSGSSGGNTSSQPGSAQQSGNAAQGQPAASGEKVTIALLLPETATSPRYESQDKPHFMEDVKQLDPNVNVIYSNAQGNASSQQQQAEAAISNGAKVLVLDPVDAKAAAVIANKAKQSGVAVISYDRLITGTPNVDYYVSFDNERVGRLQGQYIADHTKKGGTVVLINGAQTDNNALLFAKGAHEVLDPLFQKGTLKKGYESYTPDWDAANGLREMEQALTTLNNKVDGVLAANDNLAGSVIQALRPQGLVGKVPITGQDATDQGLKNIALGYQSMTVYKPIKDETQAAAKLAVALAQGQQPPAGLVNGQIDNGSKQVPSILLTPIVVTKENIADTVIKDGFTTWDKIGVPPQ